MTKIEVYTTTTCPYCVAAKALLRSKGVEFEEINVDGDEDREKMIARSSGRRTVPQIFIGDQGIGGSDDLMTLNRSGKLDQMLGTAK